MEKMEIQARFTQLEDRIRVLSSQLDNALTRVATLEKMVADAGIFLQPDKDDPANQYGNKIVRAARRMDRNEKMTLLLLTASTNRSGQPYVKTVYLHNDNSPNWGEFEQMTGIKSAALPLVANFDEARQKAIEITPLLYVEHKYIKSRGENAGSEGTKFHSWKVFPTPTTNPPPTPPQQQPAPPAPAPQVTPPATPPADDDWRQKFLKAGQEQGIPLQWLQQVVAEVPDKETGRQVWTHLMEDVDNLVRHQAENQYIEQKYPGQRSVLVGIRDRMEDYPWMVRVNHKYKRWMIHCALDLTLQKT